MSATLCATVSRGACFLAFCRFLEARGISYLVLGDTRRYPDEISGDVDIMLGGARLPDVIDLLQEFSKESRVTLVQVLQHEYCAFYGVLSWQNENGRPSYLHLDICGDYVVDSALYLRAKEMLGRRERRHGVDGLDSGFFVASAADAWIYYLLKKIQKLEISADHIKFLSTLLDRDPDGCVERTIDCLGEAADFVLSTIGDGSADAFAACLPDLRRRLRRRFRVSGTNRFAEFLRILRRIVNPTGFSIAFYGPDGAGKSTAVTALRTLVEPAFRHTKSYHLKPTPVLEGESSAPAVHPHGSEAYPLWLSCVKAVYLWAQYSLGWALRVFPAKVASGLVLFDRYAEDLAVDPLRYRYGGPAWLALAVLAVTPKPDLSVVFIAPAEVLIRRKRELSLDDLALLGSRYASHFSGRRDALIVDATQSSGCIASQIAGEVLRRLALRLEARSSCVS